ncbi:hypothetical protein BV898_11857 [Hypsibius exemplaris]|uniref:Uncharacterized protein n=1 Tax=Hypsibius exemplaris TaxID=2072580 RepID=A0A1W0WFI4_HYPEX|nr:hypothetical protein BV898_11857 [Hypsibius exemplaris]
MIDEELANAVPASITDPDEAASLKLWNKLTEIRNNFKAELKKKQEERVTFENDLRAATAQATAELAQVERELDHTNQEISSMESQIAEAENHKKKANNDSMYSNFC